MKIPGGSGSDGVKRPLEIHEQDAVKLGTSGSGAIQNRTKPGTAPAAPPVDAVNIQLAKAINAELNPENVDEERSKRIAQLKAMIEAGEYNPSSEAVARSLGQEIILEILSGSQSFADD